MSSNTGEELLEFLGELTVCERVCRAKVTPAGCTFLHLSAEDSRKILPSRHLSRFFFLLRFQICSFLQVNVRFLSVFVCLHVSVCLSLWGCVPENSERWREKYSEKNSVNIH